MTGRAPNWATTYHRWLGQEWSRLWCCNCSKSVDLEDGGVAEVLEAKTGHVCGPPAGPWRSRT